MAARKRKRDDDIEEEISSPEVQDCPICLQPVNIVGQLDACQHQFCFTCISQWGRVGENRCPLCKKKFTTVTSSGTNCSGSKIRKRVVHVKDKKQRVHHSDMFVPFTTEQLIQLPPSPPPPPPPAPRLSPPQPRRSTQLRRPGVTLSHFSAHLQEGEDLLLPILRLPEPPTTSRTTNLSDSAHDSLPSTLPPTHNIQHTINPNTSPTSPTPYSPPEIRNTAARILSNPMHNFNNTVHHPTTNQFLCESPPHASSFPPYHTLSCPQNFIPTSPPLHPCQNDSPDFMSASLPTTSRDFCSTRGCTSNISSRLESPPSDPSLSPTSHHSLLTPRLSLFVPSATTPPHSQHVVPNSCPLPPPPPLQPSPAISPLHTFIVPSVPSTTHSAPFSLSNSSSSLNANSPSVTNPTSSFSSSSLSRCSTATRTSALASHAFLSSPRRPLADAPALPPSVPAFILSFEQTLQSLQSRPRPLSPLHPSLASFQPQSQSSATRAHTSKKSGSKSPRHNNRNHHATTNASPRTTSSRPTHLLTKRPNTPTATKQQQLEFSWKTEVANTIKEMLNPFYVQGLINKQGFKHIAKRVTNRVCEIYAATPTSPEAWGERRRNRIANLVEQYVQTIGKHDEDEIRGDDTTVTLDVREE